MIARMPPPLTWHIFQIIVDVLSLVVSTCVFNQSKGHWLLSDSLNSTISICFKLIKEFGISISFDNVMEDESIIALELNFLSSNIKKEVCVVLDFIFLEKIGRK
jgi:hypothetical protein